MDGAIILAAGRLPHRPGQRPPDARRRRSRPPRPAPGTGRPNGWPGRSTCPVLSVSAAMSVIAVYRNDLKHTVQPTGWLHDRTDQALATMQRFRSRFDVALGNLSILEVEDTVSVGRRGRRHPGRRDGPAHRRGGGRLPGRAGRGRPPGRACSRPSWPTGWPGPSTWWSGTTAVHDPGRGRGPGRRRRVGRRAAGQPALRRAARPDPGGRRSSGSPARSTTPSRGSSPGATACCTTCPGSPTPSSSGSWTGSSTSSRSCGPRSPSSSRSRGWARPGPTRSRTGLARLAEASIFERYQ